MPHSLGLSVLPTEIWEYTIDFIPNLESCNYYDVCDILSACALVCRSWVPRCRLHIFCDVRLYSKKTATKFLNTLSISPSFGRHVEFLSIECEEGSSGRLYDLLIILPTLLVNLQDLTIISFPNLHPISFVLLRQFTTVRSLTLLEVEHLSFREIVRIINGFKNLRTLEVLGCRWETPGSFYSRRPLKPSSLLLHTHSGAMSADAHRWVVSRGSETPLLELRVNLHFNIPYTQDLIQGCSPSLRRLSLSAHRPWTRDNGVDPTASLPLLTNHTNLQYLSVVDSNPRKETKVETLLPLLRDLPQSLPISLRYLQLCFPEVDSDRIFGDETLTSWKSMDAELAHSRFSKLEIVEIQWQILSEEEKGDGVAGREPPDSHWESIQKQLLLLQNKDIFKNALPGVYQRGLLWCSDWPESGICVSPIINGADDWSTLPAPLHRRAYRTHCESWLASDP